MKKRATLLSLTLAVTFVLSGCGEDRSHPKESGNPQTGSKKEKIPFITETAKGKEMRAHHFAYIPGGFDVDGDGVNEGGFWLAESEARETQGDVNISSESNISALIVANFKAFSGNGFHEDINTSSYKEISAAAAGFAPVKVVFDGSGNPKNNISALEAILSLKNSQIANGYGIGLPSEKQWMQLVKLAINNPDNWTGGLGTGTLKEPLIFANGLLGNDTNVDQNYTTTVEELSGSLSEWTTGAFKASDRIAGATIYNYTDINASKVPAWWMPKLKDVNTTLTGVGGYYGGVGSSPVEDQQINVSGLNNGAYAVTARGGEQLQNGLSAAWVQYGFGYKYENIGFRAASPYIIASHYPYTLQ